MNSCFASDACGGERCSLPTRLAVQSGSLIGFIQRLERDAKSRCEVIRERERREREERERQEAEQRRIAEAEAARKLAEAKRAERAANTVRLTICNTSSHDRIWVSILYYDYNESDWIVEGWWNLARQGCAYIGDHVRRGYIYFYGHSAGERYVWRGNHGLCVSWSRFRRAQTKGYNCNSNSHRRFIDTFVLDGEYRRDFGD